MAKCSGEFASRGIPPFYVTRTLLGYGAGQQDLNRVTLNMPGDRGFIIYEMGEPRDPAHESRLNALAAMLSEIWEKSHAL